MKKEYKRPLIDIYVISASDIMETVAISGEAGENEYGDSKGTGGGSNMWEHFDNGDDED